MRVNPRQFRRANAAAMRRLRLSTASVISLVYATPNVKLRGFKWVTPGSVFALVVWILASAAFAFYVANFGSYDKTYGTLGGVIAFLTWLWISNIAILLGAELNAEIERGRQIEKGFPPEKEPFLPARDTTNLEKDREKTRS